MAPLLVRHLMTPKVVTLFEELSLPLARDLMKLKHVRHLPVVDAQNRLVGLVTHRDLLAAQVSSLADLDDFERRAAEEPVPVSSVMQRDVWTITPDAEAVHAAELLADHRFGCLPVVDADRHLVGIVTDSDFLRLAVRVLRFGPHAAEADDSAPTK